MKLKYICFILATAALLSCFQPARARKYDSVEGLVLAGYQGWFNAEGDGAQLGWKHYQKDGEFRPGMCSIDLWPDVSEYGKTYATAFSFPDGSAAEVFSSHDRSTTMLHFSWMRQYGIDGVFMQRFIASLRTGKGKANYNDILLNALDASDEYGRAICVMYDLSGISSEEAQMLLDDWKELTEKYRITSRANYLHQNGKPLVAVWGAGFDDGRRYGLDDVERIVDFLKEEGCAVLLGVPAHWRTLSMDAVSDPKLLEVIDKADIVHPWFVGRFNYDSCDRFLGLMEEDLEWCRKHGKIYMPVVFPGFSWYNLKDGVAAPLNSIPRLGGKFFWKQVCNVLSVGAETMYIAMFDEMDEGTAIFKCANKVPVGESPFLSYEGYETDRYLWLAGMAGKALRGEIEATVRMPERPSAPVKEPVDYVNPNMGGISHLLVPTYPTVHLPNGMMRVYPQRENFAADLVNGLPFIVTSHRGKSAFNLSFGQGSDRKTAPCYRYRCDNEKIKPYLYTVYFEEEEVSARYAPSYHSGIYELHFDRDEAPYLIVNTSSGGLRYDAGRLYGSNSIDGKTSVYLCAVFSVTPSGIETFGNGDGEYIVLRFPSGTAEIGLRYGVSFIDENQAEANLDGEIKDFNLDSVARKGRDIWNRQLGLVRVEGSDEDAKTVFYTSLYRICERMVCLTEGDRYFSAYDGKVHTDTIPFYTDDWVWDTYHAAHPLRVLVEPEKETDMLRSYIRMAEQLDPQWMPTFPEVTGDSRRMNCNHSVAIMIDAWKKGLHGFDLDKAYRYSKAGITEKTLAPWSGEPGGGLTDFYWKHGYVPALAPGEKETFTEVDPREKRQPVAVTLGTAYDEWCLALTADELGRKRDAVKFAAGSYNYRNLFNSETKFFHPKDSEGNFIMPFDYSRSGGQGARDAYDENNGWIYRWDVKHNIADLVSLYGGPEAFIAELDRTFATPIKGDRFEFYSQLPDHTGNVGQFSMANEPSMHIPYLYCYAGCPWKTQKRIRTLVDTWFRNDLMGVPGDEDGGGMSAFVVFSMLGFYPVTPGLPMYVIGSPWFENATLTLGNGTKLAVRCRNYSPENKYIQSASLNGEPLDRCWFSHDEIASGGVLEFVMGNRPAKDWAAGSVPPSGFSKTGSLQTNFNNNMEQ